MDPAALTEPSDLNHGEKRGKETGRGLIRRHQWVKGGPLMIATLFGVGSILWALSLVYSGYSNPRDECTTSTVVVGDLPTRKSAGPVPVPQPYPSGSREQIDLAVGEAAKVTWKENCGPANPLTGFPMTLLVLGVALLLPVLFKVIPDGLDIAFGDLSIKKAKKEVVDIALDEVALEQNLNLETMRVKKTDDS